ncbi:MAG: hypothetical protein HC901_00935 [Bdellovibrionaceae bacterium]|nr:hypothetical protein [Pseudobdellovibrionaceae bacterium]
MVGILRQAVGGGMSIKAVCARHVRELMGFSPNAFS